MERPSLQQLVYLVAVDDHRHFGKAAEACFVSQPALSAQIRELERRLGVTLFERGNRKVLPTAVGTAVIDRARGVLRDMDELVAAAHLDPAGLRGPLALGVIPTMAPYLLPGLLPVLTAAHRHVELHLHELKTAEILRLLRDGGLDLGSAGPACGRGRSGRRWPWPRTLSSSPSPRATRWPGPSRWTSARGGRAPGDPAGGGPLPAGPGPVGVPDGGHRGGRDAGDGDADAVPDGGHGAGA